MILLTIFKGTYMKLALQGMFDLVCCLRVFSSGGFRFRFSSDAFA